MVSRPSPALLFCRARQLDSEQGGAEGARRHRAQEAAPFCVRLSGLASDISGKSLGGPWSCLLLVRDAQIKASGGRGDPPTPARLSPAGGLASSGLVSSLPLGWAFSPATGNASVTLEAR